MRAWIERAHFRTWGWLYILLGTWIVYWLSNNHQYMAFNYYTYLADAFLQGTVAIDNPPSWFIELANIDGQYFVRLGPLPALVLLPVVAVFGLATNEAYVSLTLGAVDVMLVWLVLGKVVKDQGVRLAGTILFGFGTVFWFHAAYGNSWYFAHVIVDLFLLLGIEETLRHKPRGLLLGFYLACAVVTRLSIILALPYFAIMLWHKNRQWVQVAGFIVALGMILTINGYYNFVRFGSFTETGYEIVELQSHILPYDPEKGLFHLSYFPFDAGIYFLKGFEWIDHFPFVIPNRLGLSIFLTTPALIYAFWGPLRRNWLTILCWLSVVLLMLPSLFYFYVGWTEFGWRYSLDFMPFLIILITLGFREKLDKWKIALIALSILVNFWGVLVWRVMKW